MKETHEINMEMRSRMKALSCCILIPTYNNASTLEEIVRGALRYCEDVIVINDGSTDQTDAILKEIPGIDPIGYAKNKGKGFALKSGLRRAHEKGFAYAISIDSDGQHSVDDIPVFLDEIERSPGSLIVGKRNMHAENKPKKNSFANKFSNFWFRVIAGKKAPDTQSGYRLYPVGATGKMKFFSRRYEFEVEILVRCAWKGIPIVSVPVKVIYLPAGKRVSHFRPFMDFSRISLLNTVLFLISILFMRPFNFLRALNRKNIRDFFVKHLLSPDESNFRKALSVTIGTFIGIIPIWGWQIAVAITVSVVFKLNRMITIVSSNISIPPMIPVIIYISYKIGGLIIKQDAVSLGYHRGITLEYISQNFLQYLVGSIVLAITTALLFGFITWALLSLFRKQENNPGAAQQN